MATDWGMVAIRLGLYLSLILLVGLAAFPLYALRKAERADTSVFPTRSLLSVWAAAGILLSVLGYIAMIASMSGAPLTNPDWETARAILLETPIGTAWLVRMAALFVALGAALYSRSNEIRAVGVTLAAAVALSSLVWTGHAGASEGSTGLVHQASDMLHMLAAAIWLGGIAAFLLLLREPVDHLWGSRLVIGHRALDDFSRVGAICVAVIAVTGLINGQMLVGFDNLFRLFGSTYGQLLVLKLLLVGTMLLLAANNRWRLTPGLGAALADGEAGQAVSALRRSLGLEALAAATILALVAWLGMLEPTSSMAMP